MTTVLTVQDNAEPVIVLSKADSGERLDEVWEAGATQVLPKASRTPKQVVDAIRAAAARE